MKGNKQIFDNLFFVALAASGKSEVITFIKKMPPEERARELHIGRELVILDDFVYVDLMRRVDEALCQMNKNPVFFSDPKKPFKEPHISWKLLIQLLNYDYERMITDPTMLQRMESSVAARKFLADLEEARITCGDLPLFSQMPNEQIEFICNVIKNKTAFYFSEIASVDCLSC